MTIRMMVCCLALVGCLLAGCSLTETNEPKSSAGTSKAMAQRAKKIGQQSTKAFELPDAAEVGLAGP